MDRETKQILTDEKKLSELVKHEGWSLVKDKWANMIMDLQSIRNVRADSPEQAAIEIKARMLAMDILLEWIRDIEGTAEKTDAQNYTFKKESVIMRVSR